MHKVSHHKAKHHMMQAAKHHAKAEHHHKEAHKHMKGIGKENSSRMGSEMGKGMRKHAKKMK